MQNAKICKKCGKSKPLGSFPKRRDSADGHRNDCLVCNKADQLAYREANRARLLAKEKARYLSLRDQIVEQRRTFRAEEGGRINEARRARRAEDPERFRQAQRESWRRRKDRLNAERRGRQFRRRRIRIELLLERDGEVCGICRQPLGPVSDAHVDHIYPRSLGGGDELENLQLAHAFCNQSKQARLTQGQEPMNSQAS